MNASAVPQPQSELLRPAKQS